jgi:hypothetical protein
MTECSIYKKYLAVLLPAPSTKCCGELSWNLKAMKYGYPLYWKRKTQVNVVLCSCLPLVPIINFFGLILPYREFTCQTNSPLICTGLNIECGIIEVPGQQNPLESTASLTLEPSKMRYLVVSQSQARITQWRRTTFQENGDLTVPLRKPKFSGTSTELCYYWIKYLLVESNCREHWVS